MSIVVTRTNLVTTFITEWAEASAVYTENVHAAPPTDEPYVLAQIAPTYSEQPCLGRDSGQTWERDLGDLILSVHVPVNWTTDGLDFAEDARKLMAQRRVGETITDVGRTVPAGVTEDARYYLYNVIIPFRTDNIKEV